MEFHATVESTSEIGAEVPLQNVFGSHGMLLRLFPRQERRLSSSIEIHSRQEASRKTLDPVSFASETDSRWPDDEFLQVVLEI